LIELFFVSISERYKSSCKDCIVCPDDLSLRLEDGEKLLIWGKFKGEINDDANRQRMRNRFDCATAC